MHGYDAGNSSQREPDVPRPLKLTLATLAALVGLGAATFSAAVWLGERKLHRAIEVRVVPVPYARDAASVRHGKYLYDSRGCAHCHGWDGQGAVVIDDPRGFYVRGPDITSAGATAQYTEGDWVRAIRHGVSPNGHPLLVMPSEDYNRMSDADFAALVSYVRALPPGAGKPGEIRLPLLMKALYGLDQVRDAAQKIDHKVPPSQPVPVGPTVEHGAYVAQMCTGCHGAQFSGGKIPGTPPEWPPASNLTPGEGGVMGRYDTLEKFAAMMRTGKRPDGSDVNPAMPFPVLKNLNDVDMEALHAFLLTLPPRSAGRR